MRVEAWWNVCIETNYSAKPDPCLKVLQRWQLKCCPCVLRSTKRPPKESRQENCQKSCMPSSRVLPTAMLPSCPRLSSVAPNRGSAPGGTKRSVRSGVCPPARSKRRQPTQTDRIRSATTPRPRRRHSHRAHRACHLRVGVSKTTPVRVDRDNVPPAIVKKCL